MTGRDLAAEARRHGLPRGELRRRLKFAVDGARRLEVVRRHGLVVEASPEFGGVAAGSSRRCIAPAAGDPTRTCGEPLTGKRADAETCSESCRARLSYWNRKRAA